MPDTLRPMYDSDEESQKAVEELRARLLEHGIHAQLEICDRPTAGVSIVMRASEANKLSAMLTEMKLREIRGSMSVLREIQTDTERLIGEVIEDVRLEDVPLDPLEHKRDADCAGHVDQETDTCVVCGTLHGEPCPICSARAFHEPGCPAIEGRLQ